MQVLHVEGRRRPDATRVASCDDFLLREGEPAAEDALFSANVTPYCLDHDRQRMIFVETEPGCDLTAGPFYYQAQHLSATRLYAVPYARVHQLAAELPAPGELIFLYSVGRCGSTLVSKMWQQLDGTSSLSEPDLFTDVNRRRRAGHLDDLEAARLVGSAMRFLARASARRLVVKFRTQCLELANLLGAEHPQAKLLFMYRDAVAGVDSFVRVFGGDAISEAVVRKSFPSAAPLGEEYYRRLGRIGWPLWSWAAGSARYLAMRAAGQPIVALRYEELVEAPHATVAAMFRHCGAGEALVPRALPAMDADAQAGTPLARNPDGRSRLTAEEREQIRHFLWHHTGMTPDVRLEGTLGGA